MKHCVPVLGLILLATSAAGQTSRPASTPASTPTSRPTATGSKEALVLAQRVFDYAGGQALSKAHNVVFTFQAGQNRKRLFWDFRARKVRVEYPEPPANPAFGARISVLVFDIAKNENVLRHPPRPNPRAPRVSAKRHWINDSYWLLVTLKVLDPGVILSLDKPKPGDLAGIRRLRLRFHKVGLTPKNQYVLHVESDTGRVVRWDYYRRSGVDQRRVRSWEFKDYRWVGPLRLSLSRPQFGNAARKIDIQLLDVRVNVPTPKDVWTATERLFLQSGDR